jgi:hypothetical protein
MKIITLDMSINGNMVNAVDMQNYFGCDMVVLEQDPILHQKYFEVRLGLRRPVKYSVFTKSLDDDVLIMDYKTFLYALNERVPINCDKIIIMDCLELSLQQLGITDHEYYQERPDIEGLVAELYPKTELQFLMPKFNYERFDLPFPCDSFHKKINFNIMDFPVPRNDDYVFRGDVDNSVLLAQYPQAIECKIGKRLYKAGNFVYNRRSTLANIEQFGRIIFELYHEDHAIWTVGDIFDTEDGLSEHLRLLGASVNDGKLFIPSIEDLNMNDYKYLDKYL